MPYFIHYLCVVSRKVSFDEAFYKIALMDYSDNKKLFVEFLDWFTNIKNNRRQLAFVNRQPTLISHGVPGVKLIPCDDDTDVIKVSPLFIEPLNADHDGDTLAIYCIHDEKALEELEKQAYLKNIIFYDANLNILSTVRHEALYAMYVLTRTSEKKLEDVDSIKISSFKELPESIDLFNSLLTPVEINKSIISYGIALINKWMGAEDEILINKVIAKKQTQEVSKIIYFRVCNNDNDKFYDILTNLERNLMFFISATKHCPSLNIEEMVELVDPETKELFNKIPSGNAYIGFHLNEGLIERCIKTTNEDSEIYKLFKSGSRFSKTQLARSTINIGFSADDKNIVDQNPINSNLLWGLTEKQFFQGAPGMKKGVSDKAKVTPTSGYIERTMSMNMSPMEIAEEDCGTEEGIDTIIFSKDHAESLIGKYFKCPQEGINEWKEFSSFKIVKNYINKKIILRSTMLCKTKDFKICRKCFGNKKIRTKYVGVIAGQCSIERMTQLIMRSFHTSGAAILKIEYEVLNFIRDYLIDIREKDEKIELIFNAAKAPDTFQKVKGFSGFDFTDTNQIIAQFNYIDKKVRNFDTIQTVARVREILKKDQKVKLHPSEYYTELIGLILSVGSIYSSYIEMMLTHMFVTDIDKKEFWRYNPTKKIVLKLSDKTLAAFIRPLLGLIYQPNKQSISKIDLEEINKMLEDINNIDINKLSIHEKLYLGVF